MNWMVFAFGRGMSLWRLLGWTLPKILWNLSLLLFCGKGDFSDITVV